MRIERVRRIVGSVFTRLLALIGLMTAVMAGNYFYIRWVLKPLRWLKKGAAEVGGGDLRHRVPEKRSEELNLQPVLLAGLIRTAAAPFVRRKPGIRFGPREGEVVAADPDKVATVFKNILENAFKYSEEGTAPVRISLTTGDRGTIVKVRDHGIGIPREAQPYLFEPFFRVDGSRSRETGGYGLGLSLCKTIMTAHGGRIDIESAPGEGTTVSLAFARDASRAGATDETAREA